MSSKTIVIASSNRGKLQEFAELLGPRGVTVASQGQFTDAVAEETGSTFIANALLKARHAAAASGLPAIADDSGIEVDALNGAPGVYSARFAGEQATDTDNNDKLLKSLADFSRERRTARFRCALAYVRNAGDSDPLIAEASWEGRVLEAPVGTNGFGYDCIFMPNDSSESAAAMSRAEKNLKSHRAQALRRLLRILSEHGELT